FDRERQDQLAGDAVEGLAEPCHGKRQHLLVRFFQVCLDLGGVRLNDGPRLHHQIVDIGKITVTRDRKYIRVAEAATDDDGPRLVIFEVFDLFPDHFGLFEIHFFGAVAHFFFELLDHRFEVAPENVAQLLQSLLVIVRRLPAFTGPLAVSQVVFETDLVLAFLDLRFSEVQLAGSQLDVGPDQVEQFPDPAHRRIRPEVFGPVAGLSPGEKDARERFVPDDDIGIALIVLEVDIELRLVLLDERVLEEKSVLFGVDDRELDAPDALHQLMRLEGSKRLCEVGTDAFAQVLGLPHVNQFILLVEILIDARIDGNRSCDPAELFRSHGIPYSLSPPHSTFNRCSAGVPPFLPARLMTSKPVPARQYILSKKVLSTETLFLSR